MSVITHHTSLPDTANKTDFYSIIDNATCTGIVDDDIASTAAISPIKLATITTSGKVDGSALNNLANIPSGAGLIPAANIPTTYLVPSGIICMWSGTIATVPSGWFLCNGSNSTPDLRNLFIVGADADVAGVAKSTITGAALQTHATGIVGNHVHPVKTSNVTGGATTYVRVGVAAQQDTSQNTDTNTSGNALNIAPFYALAFIMKS